MQTQNSNEQLVHAELLFKFAVGMSAASHTSDALLVRPSAIFTWGKHSVDGAEMALTKPQEQWATVLSEHCATFLLMLQLDRALQDAIPNRFQHVNADVRAAVWIARLIRNAFAHAPFDPAWKFTPESQDREFKVRDVLTLKTAGLGGVPVKREHYGGPLALYRLVQFCRREVLP